MASIANIEPPKLVLGVDLGSVQTRAAIAQNGLVDMIKDCKGNYVFPPPEIQPLAGNPEESEDTVLSGQWPPEAHILKHLKDLASVQLDGASVEHAVITVRPKASDNDRQRLKDISLMVGLEVVRIINAPMAACIAHELDKITEAKKAVVCDMGPSGLSVSVYEIEDGILDMVATGEDTTLAGSFSFPVTVERSNKSSAESVDLAPHVNPDIPSHELLGQKGDRANSNYILEMFQAHVTRVLDQVKMRLEEIDCVIATGVPSNDFAIRKLVYDIFKKEPLSLSSGNQQDAVAIGAAIQGNALVNSRLDSSSFVCSLAFLAPLNIGIETSGGLFCEIFGRNSIPGQRSRVFTIASSSRSTLKIRIFDGISKLVEHNRFLGKIELADVAPGSRISVMIDWSVEDLSIVVTAKNESSDDVQTFRVPKHLEPGSKEIDQVFKERERRAEPHNKDNQLSKLLDYVKFGQNNLGDVNHSLYSKPPGERIEELSKIEEWAMASGSDVELDEIEERLGQARALVEGDAVGLPVLVE